jgi:hypothetical protein
LGKLFTPKISLSGGIGNQLFQWAAAHTLFEGTKISFDLGHYGINKEREFQLAPIAKCCKHIVNHRGATHRLSSVRALEWAAHKGVPVGFMEILGYFREEQEVQIFRSRTKKRASLGLPITVNGLFQNGSMVEQSFHYIESELDFALNKSFDSLKTSKQIPKEYMAVHVRRGDYPISDTPSKAIGQLDDNYFIRHLAEVDLPIILLTENSSEVLNLSKALKPHTILSDTEASPLQTLALMSNAQFFVGSNSSLSWWGAYLATKLGNPSILPEKWSQWGNYENSSLKNELIQFFPSTWMLSGHSEIY